MSPIRQRNTKVMSSVVQSGIIRWKLMAVIILLLVVSSGLLLKLTTAAIDKSSLAFVKAQGAGMSRYFTAITAGESNPVDKINQIGSLFAGVKSIPGVYGYSVFTTPELAESSRLKLQSSGLSSNVISSIKNQQSFTKNGWIRYYSTNQSYPGVPGNYLTDAVLHRNDVTFVSDGGYLATLTPILSSNKVIGIIEVDQTPNEGAIPMVNKILVNNLWYIISLFILFVIILYLLIGQWVVRPIKYQATHDLLTGLYNQMTFWHLFEETLTYSQSRGTDLSVLVLDVDNFKEINDNHGHQRGDEVLKIISAVVKQNARELDIVGRIGGEEFGVVLPGCSVDDAVHIAERIRNGVSTHSVGNKTLTISIGVCSDTLFDKCTPKSLAHSADVAMYSAKQTGKNKVVTYDPTMKMIKDSK